MPQLDATSSFLIEDNGDAWVGSRGQLWYYSTFSGKLTNYDKAIRPLVKNNCLYRQIFKDKAGVIWLATDFGAIKIVRSDNFVRSTDLFSNILSDGHENCSNVFCSIRGLTEDENGQIYFSYYNSIHTYDPRTEEELPLFPSYDFFNPPFGILYHQGKLYTGNGKKIDLQTLKVDTLFKHSPTDLGVVIKDQEDRLWFGFEGWLYIYQPELNDMTPFEDAQGQWDTIAGRISHLYQAPRQEHIWVSTLDNGVYQVDPERGRIQHYHDRADSPVVLRHRQVNAVYEDKKGFLWLATAYGLHRLHLASGELEVFTTEDGLPNNFINGILPEQDSVLWISTDLGLSRFSINRYSFLNFSANDGLSANEFNRMSFYKAKNGRMYFGGLNGLNAFYPGDHFLELEAQVQSHNIRIAELTRLDGQSDSLIRQTFGLQQQRHFVFSPWDRFFSFKFSHPDYRRTGQAEFSHFLEGFDQEWSPSSTSSEVRYNNLPAGKYTLRVRAKTLNGSWG